MVDTSGTPIIRGERLSKEVSSPEGTLTILDEVSLEVASGEAIAIVGPSGSGKSTLLGVLAGLDLPTRGRVFLAGAELTALDEDGRAAVRAAHVGFVFQNFQLLPALTALENVMLPLELAGMDDSRNRGRQLLTRVGLERRGGHYPRQLSGGEQQRVALARAFARDPDVLFADEPTGNLDRLTGEHVVELLFSLNASRHTTLVLVTHEERLAAHCHRELLLDGGRLSVAGAGAR
ncbi:MAG TPA: ATP-binding cassette domain-containing protein [Gammaproteobacteria bacterium]|nr:ATP-binding cassette domain-containing protein [Gammaproteobacteria bacterium]